MSDLKPERGERSFWKDLGLGLALGQVQLSVLLSTKPADPEEICKWLVLFGQDCSASWKAYGSFSETINAVAAARPLVKRQLIAPAWDLAFAWLCDEPHRRHPALPASVLLALLSVALMWGWPLEAGILALTWNGILRVGETLMAQRKGLVLLCLESISFCCESKCQRRGAGQPNIRQLGLTPST